VSRLEKGTTRGRRRRARRSGSYRDVALAVGARRPGCLAALAASPIVFSALWTAVDVAIIFARRRGSRIAPRAARAPRSAARKKRQCLDAARAAFLEEAVDRTAGRPGSGLPVFARAPGRRDPRRRVSATFRRRPGRSPVGSRAGQRVGLVPRRVSSPARGVGAVLAEACGVAPQPQRAPRPAEDPEVTRPDRGASRAPPWRSRS